MYIDTLIDLATDIVATLNYVRDNIEPDEYEKHYLSNLEEAYDLLKDVSDLVGA